MLAARVLTEFGDVRPLRQRPGPEELRRDLADHPASGKRTLVLARYARNRRLGDAVHPWAFCALTASPGARGYDNRLRDRGTGHHATLRQLGNRLVGILHGCLKTTTAYSETVAWPTPATTPAALAA